MIYEIYALAFPRNDVSLQEKFYELMEEAAGVGLAGAAYLEVNNEEEIKEKMTKLFLNIIEEGGKVIE